MTIYNWADAPADATHCATDEGGACGFGESPFIGDWRESLEARPEGV